MKDLIEISIQNFQSIFLGVKNIIHGVRNNHVLHVSGQEPSMSSKYPPSGPPLPDTLLIEISTQNFQGIFLGVKNIIHDVRNIHVFQVLGQEPSTSSKYPPS